MKRKHNAAELNGKNDILRNMIIGNLLGPHSGRENYFFPVLTIFSNVLGGF